MSAGEYLTIAGPGHAQTRVLGSRFLGTASPVESDVEVIALLEAERKRYHDATHWCYACRLGIGSDLVERASDAGEPHGTAGQPILREIQKRDLNHCLVIVTRYYGGTKLGTGGLARAYSECAARTLDATSVIRVAIRLNCRVECPYELQSTVYAVAQRLHALVEVMPSSDRAVFSLSTSPDAMPILIAALMEAGSGRISVSQTSP